MRSIVLSVGLVAVVVAGCSDDSAPEAGSTTSASLRTTSSATLENRSQTIDEAHRDGVIAEVSAFGIAERVDLHGAIDAPEGTWALSRLTEAFVRSVPDGCVGNLDGVDGVDFICGYEYGEILLLDDRDEILRAYPMPRTPPS